MTWYYARNGQRFGPVDHSELQRLVSIGQLAASDLVWRPGLAEWRTAGETPELAPLFVRPVAPPPPPPPPPSSFSPYAPPAAPLVQPPPPAYQPAYGAPFGAVATPEYASFGSRFAAILIDQLILICAGGALGFVIGVALAAGGSPPTGEEWIFNVIGLMIGWLYFAAMESSDRQATFGKSILGLKVTDLEGGRIDFGRATGRYFGKILSGLALGLGFLTMISDERKQTWHDKMADCLVIRYR